MSKLSYEERIAAVKEYQEGKGSYETIAKKYEIAKMTLMDMVATYEFQGLSKERKKYSKELKIQAVNDYLSGKGSQIEICKKYKIRGRNQLRAWIKWYNGQKEFKERSSKGQGTVLCLSCSYTKQSPNPIKFLK